MKRNTSFAPAPILFLLFLSLTWEIGSVPTVIFAMIGWQLSYVGCYQDIDLLLHHHHLYIYVEVSRDFLDGCTAKSRALSNKARRSLLKLSGHNNIYKETINWNERRLYGSRIDLERCCRRIWSAVRNVKEKMGVHFSGSCWCPCYFLIH